MQWSAAAGTHACAQLLRQASASGISAANSGNASGHMPTVIFCWAWCLQQAACDTLSLHERSVALEILEQATAVRGPPDVIGGHLAQVNLAAIDSPG